jgi:CRISPR-associated protein Cst2
MEEKMSKHLNLTVIFKAANLNYGESFGNIMSLKKISSGGENFSYISRQALRYDIVRIMNKYFNVDLTPVDKSKGVVQFIDSAMIKDYPEIDFFGYMKTSKNSHIRKAITRLSDAVSLEPFNNEIDFSTNMGLAKRNGIDNDIFQAEIHKSFYSYTITIDLDEVGIDSNYDVEDLDKEKRAQRVNILLDSIKLLYRDIRGKRENLSPLFIIGGLYNFGNPFFYNKLKLSFTKEDTLLNTSTINEVLETEIFDKKLSDSTKVGAITNIFSNLDDIKVDNLTIEKFFKKIKTEVKDYYESN